MPQRYYPLVGGGRDWRGVRSPAVGGLAVVLGSPPAAGHAVGQPRGLGLGTQGSGAVLGDQTLRSSGACP